MTDLAVVTGASHGLGRAAAIQLARRGMDVVITSRNADQLELTGQRVEATGRHCFPLVADLTNSQDRARLVAECAAKNQSLAAFIHCAAYTPDPESEAHLSEISAGTVADTISSTFTSTVHLLAELHPTLARAGRSHVILVNSDWAERGATAPPVFAAAKAACARLFSASAQEFAKDKIYLTSLFCGDLATYDEQWSEATGDIDDPPDEVIQEFEGLRVPLTEVLRAMEFVLDSRYAYIPRIDITPTSPDYSP